MTIKGRDLTLGVFCLFVLAAPAVGQTLRDQGLDRVRALYVSADYEEALAAMPPAGGAAVTTDLELYRALCLLALGREQEAVTVVERLVTDQPLFVPPVSDTSPRMQAMFAAARSKIVPDIAKRKYGEAKASYEAKDNDEARAGFQRALDLIASLPESDGTSLADFRLLAAEFLDLSAARVVATPPRTLAPVNSLSPETPLEYTPPVPILEQLPAWIPPNSDAMRSRYVGLLRVSIGEDGRVAQATVVKSSHPAYDVAALRAAKQWVYKPATRGGTPVAAERDIQVRLIPR